MCHVPSWPCAGHERSAKCRVQVWLNRNAGFARESLDSHGMSLHINAPSERGKASVRSTHQSANSRDARQLWYASMTNSVVSFSFFAVDNATSDLSGNNGGSSDAQSGERGEDKESNPKQDSHDCSPTLKDIGGRIFIARFVSWRSQTPSSPRDPSVAESYYHGQEVEFRPRSNCGFDQPRGCRQGRSIMDLRLQFASMTPN